MRLACTLMPYNERYEVGTLEEDPLTGKFTSSCNTAQGGTVGPASLSGLYKM